MIDMGLTPGHHSGTDGEYAEEEPPLLEFNEAASDYSDCGLEGGKNCDKSIREPSTTQASLDEEVAAIFDGPAPVTPKNVATVMPAPPPYVFVPTDEGGSGGIEGPTPGDCDSITDLDAWFACKNDQRSSETQQPMAKIPEPSLPAAFVDPPPNPTAVEDCDSIAGDLDAWFA